MKKFLIKRMLFIPLGIIAYLMTLYAQHNPVWTEQVYSQTVYPVLSTVVGFLPSLVWFSVAEWFVLLFLLFCLAYIIYYTRKVIRAKKKPSSVTDIPEPVEAGAAVNEAGRGMIVYRSVMGIIALFCVVYFAFTLLCGLNYYRYSFTHYTGYSVEQSSVEELEQLCLSLADGMNQTREQLGEDTNLYALKEGDFEYYAQYSVSSIQTLSKQYTVLERPLYTQPKPVLVSGLMSDAGIGGMFFPFTCESNINVDPPFFTLPSTMAHELAHQCGFMREDEANFISYLTCMQADDSLMRYSGLFLAFTNSISALNKVDPDRAKEVVLKLSPVVQRDIAQNNQFWAQHEGTLTDISRTTNDTYLKANNQADGVHSYGRMVDLLLAEQRAATE